MLGRVRSAAREASCVSRIGQSVSVAAQYSVDASDLPPLIQAWHGMSWNPARGVRAKLFDGNSEVAELDYFGQGRAWSWVIAIESRTDTSDLTCPGLQRSEIAGTLIWTSGRLPTVGGHTNPPSSYSFVDSSLAHPRLWTVAARRDRTLLSLQRWSSCTQPSGKVALFEGLISHRGNDVERTVHITPPAASVAFFDGHVATKDFSVATQGVRNPFLMVQPRPMNDTPLGINGSDYAH